MYALTLTLTIQRSSSDKGASQSTSNLIISDKENEQHEPKKAITQRTAAAWVITDITQEVGRHFLPSSLFYPVTAQISGCQAPRDGPVRLSGKRGKRG